jgi:hypothetical protein
MWSSIGTNPVENAEAAMAKILGSRTTYHGTEYSYLRGHKVRIVAVMKRASVPNHDTDRECSYLRDEDELARACGVTADDRIEVQPWIEEEGRFSFVTSDPKAVDLACFTRLRRARISN